MFKRDDYKPIDQSHEDASGISAKKYPEPLSLSWRLRHTVPYLIGGTTFLLGSVQYLPNISNFQLGGWLFTIGSTGFLYADLSEWWMNNRVGCAFDDEYREDYEKNLSRYYESSDTFTGKYQRAENGLNFALSAFGSFLYLLGSILFIPSLNEIVLGTQIFIPGSAVIFISQSWKLYRACRSNPDFPFDKSFSLRNLSADLPGVCVDAAAGLGGLAYMIGSYLFLPEIAITDSDVLRAAVWFIVGGMLFTISGLFIVYRYYFTLNYAH